MEDRKIDESKYLDMSANCELNLTEILQQAFGSLLAEMIKKNITNTETE